MKSQSHPFKHLRTILRHRRAVFRHCVLAGIPWQGIKHDLSKFSPSEFIPSARHYDGTRSPNELERAEYGCSFAWMHHKGRNKHHFEYWTDYSPITKRMSPVKMPLRYVVEMFCDRVAASKIYNKDKYKDSDSLEYFKRGMNHYIMHPKTKELIYSLLTMLAEKGEDYTFAYIKENVLK